MFCITILMTYFCNLFAFNNNIHLLKKSSILLNKKISNNKYDAKYDMNYDVNYGVNYDTKYVKNYLYMSPANSNNNEPKEKLSEKKLMELKYTNRQLYDYFIFLSNITIDEYE